jgi:hypothetical protein
MFEIIEDDLTPEFIEKYTLPTMQKYVVYFDPLTYDILSITNEKRSDLSNFFEVEFNKIKIFLDGQADPRQYKLILNPSKTFEIISKVINQDSKSSVLVPIVLNNEDSSLTVIHTEDAWKIIISENEKSRLANTIIDYSLYIFVTSVQNKNFLYRTLLVNLEELIKNGELLFMFEDSIESDRSKIMLSTIKFFESYSLKYE